MQSPPWTTRFGQLATVHLRRIRLLVPPEASLVDLRLFNQAGQLVKHIQQNQIIEAGQHQIDVTTQGISSGLYLITLSVDGKTVTKRGFLTK